MTAACFKPFFFVHVPKTGGNSVIAALRSAVGKDNVDGFAQHCPAPSAIYKWGQEWWKSQYTFAFVRNPWDRFFSLYNWQFQRARDPNTSLEQWPFEKYTKAVLVDKLQELMRRYRNIRPMREWLFSESNQIVDYIGRFETIDQDWERICLALKIDYSPLPRRNQTSHPSYIEAYRRHPELVAIIADFYRCDIEEFGYDLHS